MAGTIGYKVGETRKHRDCLNGVRPRWPEQSTPIPKTSPHPMVSMESGLDGRNNEPFEALRKACAPSSQWSPA